MSRWRLLFSPRFIKFALKRLSALWHNLARDYQRLQGCYDPGILRFDVFVSDYRRVKKDHGEYQFSPGVRIVTPVGPCEKETGIDLGEGCWLGPNVHLEVIAGQVLRVGDFTTVNDNTVIYGDVRIGNHCLLAPDIYISSGIHSVKYHPAWLIRDQERAAHEDVATRGGLNRPVTIEDDCWVGKGVLIREGIYVGRGAVIGANCVVTKDVPPYSIQAGIPNREISKRLAFEPPGRAEALNDDHMPYFYSGFKLRLADRKSSAGEGVLKAAGAFRIVLRGGPFSRLEVTGNGGPRKAAYRVACNGAALGVLECDAGRFTRTISADSRPREPAELTSLPGVLREYNVFSFVPDERADEATVGIASVAVE
jgi:acetyltransferase-like isoleucine patch superfamily enzyme